jgi:hypothetical protein
LAGQDRAGEERTERLGAQEEPRDHGAQHREEPGGQELAERRAGADVYDPTVVGLLRVVHDARVVAELVPDLHDHLHRGAADRADRER